jgi:hypothetical protein
MHNPAYNLHGASQYPDLFGNPRKPWVLIALAVAAAADRAGAGLLTFARASVANAFNVAGTLVSAAVDTPRYDFHPTTHAPRGLLIEAAATNLFLNSATAATQTIVVSAVSYTISFYGTGTITLSGVHAHAVVGGGVFPTRTTYTFTPTAGNLVCTVTGTAVNAQLETGAVASSWITTTGASATRAADLVTVEGADFAALGLNSPSWAAVLDYEYDSGSYLDYGSIMTITDAGDAQNQIAAYFVSNQLKINYRIDGAGSDTFDMDTLLSAPAATGQHKLALCPPNAATAAAFDGSIPAYASTPFDKLKFATNGAYSINYWLRGFTVYNTRVPAAELAVLTTV